MRLKPHHWSGLGLMAVGAVLLLLQVTDDTSHPRYWVTPIVLLLLGLIHLLGNPRKPQRIAGLTGMIICGIPLALHVIEGYGYNPWIIIPLVGVILLSLAYACIGDRLLRRATTTDDAPPPAA